MPETNVAHVPGPWCLVEVTGSDGDTYKGLSSQKAFDNQLPFPLMVFHPEGVPSPPQANLIVAAPDLLAALVYLRDCIESGIEPGMSAVHRAIAKAEGRP